MKINYIKKLKYILYCSIVFPVGLKAITLEEVIKKSIYTNPQIRVAIANYEASEYELSKAQAGFKPTLDVRAETGRERTEIQYSPDGNRELNERQIAIVGRYNLFEGDKTTHEVNEKRARLEVSRNQLLKQINKVSSFMVQVYLELLRRKSLLEIEENNYKNHLETLAKVRLRLEAGDGYESDYRQTKARVKLAEGNCLIAQKQYLNSEINYRRFLGKLPILSDMEQPIVFLKTDQVEIEERVLSSKEKNLNLKIQNSEVDVTKSLHAQEESKYYPTIDLEVSQAWNNNVHGFTGKDNSQKLALVLNYNLYNGGADELSQLSALKRTEVQKGNLADIELEVEEEVRIVMMKYDLLKSQLLLNSEQLTHLLGTRELYELEYQNSKRTIIDVLNIKQEYSYAKVQGVNAQFDQLLVYYQFKRAMGELIDEFHLENILDNL